MFSNMDWTVALMAIKFGIALFAAALLLYLVFAIHNARSYKTPAQFAKDGRGRWVKIGD